MKIFKQIQTWTFSNIKNTPNFAQTYNLQPSTSEYRNVLSYNMSESQDKESCYWMNVNITQKAKFS
jgi:hypothetical protein